MIRMGKSMWIARRGGERLFWVMSYVLVNGHTQEYTNSVCIHLLSSNDQFGIPRVCSPQPPYMSLPIKCLRRV